MSVYRGMDQAALDAGYNNTTAVADSARILADWERRSASVAAAHPQHLNLRYGPRDRNRIDFFPAARAGISPRCRSHSAPCAAGSPSAASSISSRYG